MCSFQPQGLAHHSGLFVCYQTVSHVLISIIRHGSPFWSFCVPSGCKWYGIIIKNFFFHHHFFLAGSMYFALNLYYNSHILYCSEIYSWYVYLVPFLLHFLIISTHLESMSFFHYTFDISFIIYLGCVWPIILFLHYNINN